MLSFLSYYSLLGKRQGIHHFPPISTFPFIFLENRIFSLICRLNLCSICDALFFGGPLTIRQPAKYSWMSGNPTPLTKIEQSLLYTGSSTQIQHVSNSSQRPHRVHIQFKMSKTSHLGPCINTHKITYQLYTNSSRVDTSLLIQTYIKIKNLIHVLHDQCQSHMSSFFSKRPLMSAAFPIAPYT